MLRSLPTIQVCITNIQIKQEVTLIQYYLFRQSVLENTVRGQERSDLHDHVQGKAKGRYRFCAMLII